MQKKTKRTRKRRLQRLSQGSKKSGRVRQRRLMQKMRRRRRRLQRPRQGSKQRQSSRRRTVQRKSHGARHWIQKHLQRTSSVLTQLSLRLQMRRIRKKPRKRNGQDGCTRLGRNASTEVSRATSSILLFVLAFALHEPKVLVRLRHDCQGPKTPPELKKHHEANRKCGFDRFIQVQSCLIIAS